jgi:hypothetical protein
MVIAARLPALLLAAALALGGALLPASAYAGPGDLDRSYGQGGHRDLGALYELAVERVGEGRVATAALTPTGAVRVQLTGAGGDRVRSFGQRGVRVLGRDFEHSRPDLTWMPKRRLILVNAHYRPDGNEHARLWALRPDGSLAKGFGDRGTVTHGPGSWNDVQAQGERLLVVGQNQVARLRPDGLSFDPTFNGGAGAVTLSDPGLVLQEIHLHRRGFFVSGASDQGLEVFRLTGGGRRDTGWGDGTGNSTWAPPPPSGYTTTGYDGGWMDVRTRKGSIVYTGTVQATFPGTAGTYHFRVVGALRPNGYLDEDFRNGQPLDYSVSGSPVGVTRGRVLVPGSVFGEDRTAAAVTRLTSGGRVDRTYGTRGSFRERSGNIYQVLGVLPPYRGTTVAWAIGYSEKRGAFGRLIGIRN